MKGEKSCDANADLPFVGFGRLHRGAFKSSVVQEGK